MVSSTHHWVIGCCSGWCCLTESHSIFGILGCFNLKPPPQWLVYQMNLWLKMCRFKCPKAPSFDPDLAATRDCDAPGWCSCSLQSFYKHHIATVSPWAICFDDGQWFPQSIQWFPIGAVMCHRWWKNQRPFEHLSCNIMQSTIRGCETQGHFDSLY
jgi:hypothetical protein